MHEYGHKFDSHIFGLSYMFAIGIPSYLSAHNEETDPITGLRLHRSYWTERRANRHAADYFGQYFSVDWSVYDDDYPR